MTKEDKVLTKKFIAFLQTKYPLRNDLKITFLGVRDGEMSTGSRTMDSTLKILSKGRLNRDILRTLAHEWVHEHQLTILNRKHGPDIGGKNEDEANAFAGQLIKMFEKKFPEIRDMMFEDKGIKKRLGIINEQLLLIEKGGVRENLILEMKKIGIEKLPYSYSSLSKFIDSKTMDIHYNKHYKGYVKKLNDALKNKDGDIELEEIIKTISKFDDKVRNNAGGAFNHALFWKMLSPKKQLPKGDILKKIRLDFGNIKKMKDEFNEAAKERFGSGWAWLYLSKNNELKIMSTPNQDNPLMNIVKGGGYPLLGLDVWEHAYYLKYQNKRDEYIKKFWDSVNWEFVNQLYELRTKNKPLKESKIVNINEIALKKQSKITYLCEYNKLKKINDSPFCKLKDFRDTLTDQNLIQNLEHSILMLDNFFSKKIVGTFPQIINLSLQNQEKTINFLELISDFIKDKNFNETETFRVLKKQKNTSIAPENLDSLLRNARYLEHQKYESRFVGDFFDKKSTRLQLNYSCSDDAKEKLFDTLVKIQSGQETINYHFFRITNCLSNSFKSGSHYIKADLESKSDFKDEEGNVLYPKGSFFEVKKMDPFIDSYLSEFFSIFKESSILNQKPAYIELYNKLIERIFIWLGKNQLSENFLQKVKSKMSGIFYENDILIPTEFIELYWSNKGQRGCDEKRLSIRFRIDPKYTKINAYKFVDKDILEPIELQIPPTLKGKVICQ
tara:strand:- start:159 stop:2336 length:2178 start_codon:yes stop_codon:yes gene_type:complete